MNAGSDWLEQQGIAYQPDASREHESSGNRDQLRLSVSGPIWERCGRVTEQYGAVVPELAVCLHGKSSAISEVNAICHLPPIFFTIGL